MILHQITTLVLFLSKVLQSSSALLFSFKGMGFGENEQLG
jgi:hypothetical protein